MDIQKKHIYLGAALAQIVEHDSFKALNRASKRYGHFLVNTNIQFFSKYSSMDANRHQFTFTPADVQDIRAARQVAAKLFIVLVCGETTICCMSYEEWSAMLDDSATGQQCIYVSNEKGKQLRVSGTKNSKTPALVPRNVFPSRLFDPS